MTKEKRCDKILSTDNNLLRGRIVMTKSAKRILALAISGVTVFAAGGALLAPARMSVYAEEAQQAEVPISAHSDEGIMPLACTYVEMPTIQVGGMNAHYCFTTYTVTQEDTHATLLEGRIGVSDRYPCYTEHLNYKQTRNIVAHSSSSDYTCYQNNVKFIRAKCEADGVNSTYNNYLATPGHVASAKFYANGFTTTGCLTNSYDEPGFVWDHNAKDGIVYCSLAYQGEVVDFTVRERWWPYYPEERTINGVTFTVICGPNKVTLKASQDVIFNEYDTMFAFSNG